MKSSTVRVATALLVGSLAAPSIASAVTNVSNCGQPIVGPAILTFDLDCSAAPHTALTIENGPLYLNGHTLIGNPSTDPVYAAVRCVRPPRPGAEDLSGRCRIVGPGEIRTAGAGVIGGFVSVKEVRFVDNGRAIAASRVRTTDVEITGSSVVGISLYGRVLKSQLKRTTISDNAVGVAAVSCTGCGGPSGLRVRDSFISNNIGSGIHFGPLGLAIKNSDISGNALDPDAPECDSYGFGDPSLIPGCADIVAIGKPRIESSTCTTSFSPTTGGDWDICTAD